MKSHGSLPGSKLHVDVELPHVVRDPHPAVVGGQLVEHVAGDDRDRGRGVQVHLRPDALDEGYVGQTNNQCQISFVLFH